ncbi:DUF2075 domain-containing protein [Apilactobacillus apinorum]|uniref:DUF2075 domain-containing protein n=1 Tax=Apilactobacillus apinorum TaxID=1218495 RepID=UPI0006B53AC2|nr:DUF2075 domain-containing protein [Apilactobacillus apinorum]KOY69929.1 Uncharacterized protein RZ74_00860 [Apilactobacillus apinorum]CAI2610389.1 Uncharacterized protein AAPFHON13_00920 [Apilactobacillus apinorum]
MSENKLTDLPVIKDYIYNTDTKNQILKYDRENKLITRYPTVYIVIDKIRKNKFKAYVGETNNIIRRTEEHLKSEAEYRTDWLELNKSNDAKLIVIAHKEFNKSLTLDIENQLMQYLVSDDAIVELNNRRSNDQDLYYTREHFQDIFKSIWQGLFEKYSEIFPQIDDITNSAIFKASPFHKLTDEQLDARDKIIDNIQRIKKNHKDDNLIIVQGSAGTGKTVLLSSLFAELNKVNKQEAYMLVNHEEQLKIYKNISSKIGLKSSFGDDIVNKPTKFLNQHPVKNALIDANQKVDIVLVDEAHLLLTQGYMAYKGKGQLEDIKKVAEVVVAVLDPMQVLKGNGYIEDDYFNNLIHKSLEDDNFIELTQQNRMMASADTINWIEDIVQKGVIGDIPNDDSYSLKIFDNVNEMYDEVKKHDDSIESLTKGLSRLVATYDWEYKSGKLREYTNSRGEKVKDFWRVKIGDDFSLPWNRQIKPEHKYKDLSWAEQRQTINEVGSTFTIQGFDLNYCGVIIGPSVKFRNGKIIYDSSCSFDTQVKNKRTLVNKKKVDISSELIRNQLNVLLKRGVHGLFIYAVDEELRNELLSKYNQK